MKITKEFAELIGIMFGDGCLSSKQNKYVVYISGHKIDDKEYHEKITKNLFLSVFDKKIKIDERRKENTLFIRFSDKRIFNILKSEGMPVGKKYGNLMIPPAIKNDKDLIFRFICGLFDTDGCMFLSKQHKKERYYPRIEIASKSESFLREVLDILKSNGFYGSISKRGIYRRLEIPGFKNLERWLKLIGFHNPKHMRKIEITLENKTPRTRLELVTL